ncbi:MAG: transcriptional repressor [Candidatus Omnitrophica bacterium]|nr:transcriptional repressor [Candidatus Omnitrophota bacterium]
MITNKEKNLYRNTKQRQKILELLVNSKSHPTADWIYQKLKKKFKNLSLGTVYRNLRILKEKGQIWELNFGTGFSRFDAIGHSHYHFICSSCQNIYDIKIPPMKELDDRVMQITGFRILSHRLVFFGLCDVCKLKKQKNNKNIRKK